MGHGWDVSSAWAIWSSAAESAFADAYCFVGGPVPDRGLVLGRGVARFRVVRLDVQMYRDSSIAALFDLGRRLEVVQDVLDEMVRCGFSLARSLELAVHPTSAKDLLRVQDGFLGWFHEVVGVLHDRLSYFIHRSLSCVGMRLSGVGGIGLGRISWVDRTGVVPSAPLFAV